MKHIEDRYLDWSAFDGFPTKTEGELTITDHGYGVIDDMADEIFSSGQCHALAMAINALTGWKMKGLTDPAYRQGVINTYGQDEPGHVVCYCAQLDSFVDIKGAHPDKYRTEYPIAFDLTPEAIHKFKGYLKPNMIAARPFAKSVIRDINKKLHAAGFHPVAISHL